MSDYADIVQKSLDYYYSEKVKDPSFQVIENAKKRIDPNGTVFTQFEDPRNLPIGDQISFIQNSNNPSYFEKQIEECKQIQTVNLSEISRLNAEIQTLTKQAEDLEKKAQEAEKEAQNSSQKSIQKQNEAQTQTQQTESEYKNKSEKTVLDLIDEYNNGDITEEQLHIYISSALSSTPDFTDAQSSSYEAKSLESDAKSKTTAASDYRSQAASIREQISIDQSTITNLTSENSIIEGRIAKLEENLEKAEKKQQQKSYNMGSSGNGGSSGGGSGDPIGFEHNGEMYEFIRDDGNFDSMMDFLGFKNKWKEMQALDKNGDGKVDVNEFKDANIKLTNSKGEVSNILDTVGENFFVDLNSYDENGSYDNIDTNDDDNDGIINEKLYATANCFINGNLTKMKCTDVDNDYAINKYGLSSVNQINTKSATNLTNRKSLFDENLLKTFSLNASSLNIDSDIEKAKNGLETYKNSLINNPFALTGTVKVDSTEKQNEEQKKKSITSVL